MRRVVQYNDDVRKQMTKAIDDLQSAWNAVKFSVVFDPPVIERRINTARESIDLLIRLMEDVCVGHECEMEIQDSLPSVCIQVCKHCGKKVERPSWV